MPRGGTRANAGRPLGSKNRSTAEMRAQARLFTDEGLRILATIARKSRKDANRIHAVKELMDRAHGKAAQPIEGEIGVKGRVQFTWLPAQPLKSKPNPPKS